MVGMMPLLRRSDANSRSNARPATGVPDHRAANSEKEATITEQANDFRGRIFSREDIFARGYFREKIFSREDIFAGRYFRVNSIFAKISSRENISNSLFAKFSSRENKVLYSISVAFFARNSASTHRLVPWLNRELNVMLNHHDDHIQFVLELILDLIKRFDIREEEFHQHIQPFFGRRTDHFIHEFHSFARAPYDIVAYDQNAEYDGVDLPVHEIESDDDGNASNVDDDSDVVVLSPTPGAKTIKKRTNSTQNKSQTQRAKQYEVTSFLSTDCVLSTETCSKTCIVLAPGGAVAREMPNRGLAPLILRVRDFLETVSRQTDTAHTEWDTPVPGTSHSGRHTTLLTAPTTERKMAVFSTGEPTF